MCTDVGQLATTAIPILLQSQLFYISQSLFSCSTDELHHDLHVICSDCSCSYIATAFQVEEHVFSRQKGLLRQWLSHIYVSSVLWHWRQQDQQRTLPYIWSFNDFKIFLGFYTIAKLLRVAIGPCLCFGKGQQLISLKFCILYYFQTAHFRSNFYNESITAVVYICIFYYQLFSKILKINRHIST